MGAMAEARTLHCSRCGGTMTEGKKAPHILLQFIGLIFMLPGAMVLVGWIVLVARVFLFKDGEVAKNANQILGEGTAFAAGGALLIFIGLKCFSRKPIWKCWSCGNFFDRA